MYRAEYDVDRDGDIDGDDALAVGSAVAAQPLGQVSAGGGSGPDGLVGYGGYVFNRESLLYTVRYRHFSPALGRWLERDPAKYVDGSNLVQYVRSNPRRWTDPLGLWPSGLDPLSVTRLVIAIGDLSTIQYFDDLVKLSKKNAEIARSGLRHLRNPWDSFMVLRTIDEAEEALKFNSAIAKIGSVFAVAGSFFDARDAYNQFEAGNYERGLSDGFEAAAGLAGGLLGLSGGNPAVVAFIGAAAIGATLGQIAYDNLVEPGIQAATNAIQSWQDHARTCAFLREQLQQANSESWHGNKRAHGRVCRIQAAMKANGCGD